MVTKTINSDAFIKKSLSKTLTSLSVISYDDFGEIMEEGWEELIEVPEFEKTISYRRYDFDEDNITGDIDRSSYNDYSIYAEVQPMEIGDKEVKTGRLQVADAEIFLPAKINVTTDGTKISPAFRPQLYDEITWKGIVYKINKIILERIGRIEIFHDCLCKRMTNRNPSVKWNDNYTREYTSDVKPGRDWS